MPELTLLASESMLRVQDSRILVENRAEKPARFKEPFRFAPAKSKRNYRTMQYGKRASTGRREARGEYVDPQQGTHVALVDDVLDRELREHLEECIERFAQCCIQSAAIDQRAIGGIVFEALRHGEVFFGHSHHVEERDLLGWFTELHAAVAAAHGFDETILDQRLEDLEQEKF
jgi:hypothetical protein